MACGACALASRSADDAGGLTRLRDSNYRTVTSMARTTTFLHCRLHPAVGIEPSLRAAVSRKREYLRSPAETFGIFPTRGAKWEDGDRLQVRESPPTAAFSRTPRSVLTKARLPGWRRSGIRTNLQRNFPANREFNRENHYFRPQGDNLKARNRCAAGTFQQNSLSKLSGKFFRRTGNSKRIAGNFRGKSVKGRLSGSDRDGDNRGRSGCTWLAKSISQSLTLLQS